MAARSLHDFQGKWQIDRRIDDLAAGKVAVLKGQASFTPSAGGLDYLETGKLVLEDAAPIHAERRYSWQLSGGQIAVFFKDGRPFHSFDPKLERASARHLCDPDDYRVIYSFGRWPVWRTEWRVQGPRKHYRMTTEYHR